MNSISGEGMNSAVIVTSPSQQSSTIMRPVSGWMTCLLVDLKVVLAFGTTHFDFLGLEKSLITVWRFSLKKYLQATSQKQMNEDEKGIRGVDVEAN